MSEVVLPSVHYSYLNKGHCGDSEHWKDAESA